MASIISVDTLQDSAGSNEITTANVKTAFDDRVKAWVDLTGTGTATINESLNISSVTDSGTGDYTFAFTNNPASDKYVFSGSANNYRNSTGWGYECYLHQQITSSVRVKVSNNPYTNYDGDPVSVSIHGDLA